MMGRLQPPLITCDAVLSEAIFLVRALPQGPTAVLDLFKRGLIKLEFQTQEHVGELQRLFTRYADQQISLADACLVLMSEARADSLVFTLDRDFEIYRRHGRQRIPTLRPTSVQFPK
jgi:predicted nucleic acid-binding protein